VQTTTSCLKKGPHTLGFPGYRNKQIVVSAYFVTTPELVKGVQFSVSLSYESLAPMVGPTNTLPKLASVREHVCPSANKRRGCGRLLPCCLFTRRMLAKGEGFAGWSPLVTCVMRIAAFILRSVEGLGGVSGLANAAKLRFRFQHKQEGGVWSLQPLPRYGP
jgi:hypothetical protein